MNALEKMVEALLQKTYLSFQREYVFPRYYDIYGKQRRVDFFIEPSHMIEVYYPRGLVIECREQITSGSAGDKNSKTIDCLRERCPAHSLIVFSGDFTKDQLNEARQKKLGKFLGGYRLDEFGRIILGELLIPSKNVNQPMLPGM